MDKLYLWVIKNRNPLVRIFVIFNSLLVALWYLAFQAIVMKVGEPTWFFINAKSFGQAALVLFILTSIPGIMRRFGKFYKPVSILMIFRRYIGIATFMFAFLHASIERLFFVVLGQMTLIPVETFQIFGLMAFVLLFSLFVTSNDWSVKNIGPWWDRIHNLTYAIVWILFIHVGLQRLSIWTLLIGITSVAQIASHIYAKNKAEAL